MSQSRLWRGDTQKLSSRQNCVDNAASRASSSHRKRMLNVLWRGPVSAHREAEMKQVHRVKRPSARSRARRPGRLLGNPITEVSYPLLGSSSRTWAQRGLPRSMKQFPPARPPRSAPCLQPLPSVQLGFRIVPRTSVAIAHAREEINFTDLRLG